MFDKLILQILFGGINLGESNDRTTERVCNGDGNAKEQTRKDRISLKKNTKHISRTS